MNGKPIKVDGTITGKVTKQEETIKGSLSSLGEAIKGTVRVPPYRPFVTDDYDILQNKPRYNGVVWEGNKTFEDVGDYNLTNQQIKAIFDRVFRGGN